MCPFAQKQVKQMPDPDCTTSARSTKDVSVMLCLKMQFCEGRVMTLACFSEQTTAYWCSFSSCEVDGETDTGRLFLPLSLSSPLAGALGSYHSSEGGGSRDPVASRKAIRMMLPFSLMRVPLGETMTGCSSLCSPAGGMLRETERTVPKEVPTHRAGVSVLSVLRVYVSQK